MPIHDLGGGCFRWGNHGAKYCGPGAREKAIKQMKGAFFNGYKGDSHGEEDQKESPINAYWDALNDYEIVQAIIGGRPAMMDKDKPTTTHYDLHCILFSKSHFAKASVQLWLDRHWKENFGPVTIAEEDGFWYVERVAASNYTKFKRYLLENGVTAVCGIL